MNALPINDNWPTHADGSNKTVGQMNEAERRAVMLAARARFMARNDKVKALVAEAMLEAWK